MNNAPKRIWARKAQESTTGNYGEWYAIQEDMRTYEGGGPVEYLLASDRDELIKRVVAGMPDLAQNSPTNHEIEGERNFKHREKLTKALKG